MAELFAPDTLYDLDNAPFYEVLEKAIMNDETKNFGIEFDQEKAKATIDLTARTLPNFLQEQRGMIKSTRWINIFAPHKQKQIVGMIAKNYGLSPRLAGMMCSSQVALKPAAAPSRRAPLSPLSADRRSMIREMFPRDQRGTDPEKTISSSASLDDPTAPPEISHWKLVNEVWHYCSVDWGRRYVCIGYNSLTNSDVPIQDKPQDESGTSQTGEMDSEADFGSSNFPPGKRVWTWLILCDDGTVISLLEDPFPSMSASVERELSDAERRALIYIRRNLLNVVRQLSAARDEWRKNNPISVLDIRPNMKSNLDSNMKIVDCPGLLVYYLFDDWYTSYALVAKKEQQYATRLSHLRHHLFQKPDTELIKSLHQAGRQLSVLKRIYESYALIVKRLLEKEKQRAKRKMRNNPSGSGLSDSFGGAVPVEDLSRSDIMNGDETRAVDMETYGVPMTQPAIARFERLLDRINLYALTEIQECMDEKADLVFLNFNLITLKESSAIEKLTRITILLAKATILFLPVSLMTGYFSTQIQDLQNKYTVTTYWVSFTVILFLSFMFLAVFGMISGTLEGDILYRSFTKIILDAGKQIYRGVRVKKRKA